MYHIRVANTLRCDIHTHTHSHNIGVVYYYGLLQIAMWLLFHSGALFWGIVFPFHYRRWKNEGRFKYIHITTVILALLVPTIPAFVNLRFGYAVFSSPTFACQGTNANSTYATLILPFSIIWAISSSMLAITFWTIFKVSPCMQFTVVCSCKRNNTHPIITFLLLST